MLGFILEGVDAFDHVQVIWEVYNILLLVKETECFVLSPLS